MKNILIIGGGAMGSAFSIPCIEKRNKVTITEPYSKIFIRDISSKNKFHSALKIKLPKNQQDRDMLARELLIKFQMSPNHPLVQLKRTYAKGDNFQLVE